MHSFYLYLLESALGNEVPVPPSIAHDADVLLRFVLLLDMAVTPQMVRDGLKSDEHKGWAEALLRFCARKEKRRAEDRDKADVVATALYRMTVSQLPIEATDSADDSERIGQFEDELSAVCQDVAVAPPANEHLQLVREFQFLREEVEDFRHFDELIDSGVIQKVREIKQSLDPSFLHPSVLATVASYNYFFGQRFDELFKRAAKEVKTFAMKVQQDGGSIMSRVDGDVIVKHLAEVDDEKILNEEYGRAQENLRRVSKLKKAVDNRRFGKVAVPVKTPVDAKLGGPVLGGTQPVVSYSDQLAQTAAAQANRPPLGPTSRPEPRHRASAAEPPAHMVPRSSSGIADIEIERIHAVQVTIRSFVRAADPALAHVVPLPFGSLVLTAAEADAFRAEYGNEKSFRADCVSTLMQLAALEARLIAELHEFDKTKYAEYSWKPHADALAYLLSAARTASDAAAQLQATAKQRGLTEKVSALGESLEKLRARAHAAGEALQAIG